MLFDSQSGKCVVPADQAQGLALATRNDLQVLRDGGDPLTLVELHLATPVDRQTAGKIISAIQPDTVDAIGFYFRDVEGGFQVQAITTGAAPTIDQLVNQARTIITARYAALGDSDSGLAKQFGAAFDTGSEGYSVFRLHGLPSRLLATWAATPGISYISVDKGQQ